MQLSQTTPITLSIAGSDPSGGAGIQCDLKTFMAHKVYGMAIPTMLTIQNTQSLIATHPVPPSQLRDQIKHLLADISPNAIKIGALSDYKQAQVLHECLQNFQGSIVWDPVLISSSGHNLMVPEDISSTVQLLSQIVTLATPNHLEQVHFVNAHCAILTTNGENSDSSIITDELKTLNGKTHHYTHPKYQTKNTHGTGCTLSSSITANLAKGLELHLSCSEAIRYCVYLLSKSNKYDLGSGNGSLGHELSSWTFPR